MTLASAPKLMTADELMELEDDDNLYELSRGILICMSPSAYGPGQITGEILVKLGDFVDQHRLGEYGTADAGFRLASDPDTVRAPDAWFVRAGREPSGEDRDRFFLGPPDLAIEVLSPSDRFDKVMLKVRDYLDAGTPLVWYIDPLVRTTAVFRPGAAMRFVDADQPLDGEDVLPGFTLRLADILHRQ